MATLNIGMKVNRSIGGATTVSANAYAMVTYVPSLADFGYGSSSGISFSPVPITRIFGPSQAVPATFTTTLRWNIGALNSNPLVCTWTLVSGVELVNTQ